jgi:hypothetical protein
VSLALCLYLITFILFLSIFASGMIWGAMLAGMPTLYIVMGVLIIFAIGVGIFKIVGRSDNQASSAD